MVSALLLCRVGLFLSGPCFAFLIVRKGLAATLPCKWRPKSKICYYGKNCKIDKVFLSEKKTKKTKMRLEQADKAFMSDLVYYSNI